LLAKSGLQNPGSPLGVGAVLDMMTVPTHELMPAIAAARQAAE
jgi:hypothetical protein